MLVTKLYIAREYKMPLVQSMKSSESNEVMQKESCYSDALNILFHPPLLSGTQILLPAKEVTFKMSSTPNKISSDQIQESRKFIMIKDMLWGIFLLAYLLNW